MTEIEALEFLKDVAALNMEDEFIESARMAVEWFEELSQYRKIRMQIREE